VRGVHPFLRRGRFTNCNRDLVCNRARLARQFAVVYGINPGRAMGSQADSLVFRDRLRRHHGRPRAGQTARDYALHRRLGAPTGRNATRRRKD